MKIFLACFCIVLLVNLFVIPSLRACDGDGDYPEDPWKLDPDQVMTWEEKARMYCPDPKHKGKPTDHHFVLRINPDKNAEPKEIVTFYFEDATRYYNGLVMIFFKVAGKTYYYQYCKTHDEIIYKGEIKKGVDEKWWPKLKSK